jgi:hypothetical protein
LGFGEEGSEEESGPQEYHVTWDWRRWNNEQFHDSYRSPNTIRVIKLREMRWAGHVARTEERRIASRVFVGET